MRVEVVARVTVVVEAVAVAGVVEISVEVSVEVMGSVVVSVVLPVGAWGWPSLIWLMGVTVEVAVVVEDIGEGEELEMPNWEVYW